MSAKNTEAVKVVVRCRPLNEKERQDGRQVIVDVDEQQAQVLLRNPGADAREPPKAFTFDQVYGSGSQQAAVFELTARPIVDACMAGYNGTIFAYGQTGTGKSFTMEGRDEPAELKGVIPRTFDYVFGAIAAEVGAKEFLVRASYLEIYNEDVRDLLGKGGGGGGGPNGGNPQKLELKESPERGVYARGLTQFVVKSAGEIAAVLRAGQRNRAVGATAMNQDSSRSHSIFTVTIEATQRAGAGDAAGAASGAAAAAAAAAGGHVRMGKLNLVDLAGSERQGKTGATGDRLKEGIKINLSLTALGNVISALVDGRAGSHVPYRDSKLTRLLQDSLGGNTKTVMIANVGPADWNYEETLSTLRYAHRAKAITNKPRVNEDPKDAMLRQFQDEIARLKEALEARRRAAGNGGAGAGGAGAGGGEGGEGGAGEAGGLDAGGGVAPDRAALVEQLRAQLREEMERQREQQLEGEALEAARAEAEARARQQLEAAMAASSETEEQRRAAREDLKRQLAGVRALEASAASERAEQEALLARIAAMESKVLHGGKNLLEEVDAIEARSAAAKTELDVAERQRAERQRRLEQLQLERLDLDAQYSSLEDEVAQKGAQLRALYARYRQARAEADDAASAAAAEREELLADYRALSREVKLKNLAIAAFIPPRYQELILGAAEWSEVEGAWRIAFIEAAGNNARARHEQARAASEPPPLDLPAMDAARLQRAYLRFDAPATGGGAAGAQDQSSRHGGGGGGRPASAARRATRPMTGGGSGGGGAAAAVGAAPGVIAVRPASAAARRARDLLVSAGAAAAASSSAGKGAQQQQQQQPQQAWGARSPAGAGSLLDGVAGGGGGGDGGRARGRSGGLPPAAAAAAAAAASAAEVPKARGLVRGSTDALRRTPRPPSRAGVL